MGTALGIALLIIVPVILIWSAWADYVAPFLEWIKSSGKRVKKWHVAIGIAIAAVCLTGSFLFFYYF